MANKDLELEQLKLGEIDRSSWLKNHDCSEDELDRMLAELESSDKEILDLYPADKMKSKILEKIDNQKKNNVIKLPFNFSAKTKPIMAVAAAILVCAFMIPIQLMNGKTSFAADNSSEIRVKGSSNPALFLYKFENEKAVKLSDHAKVLEGDVIQISYIAGKAKDGMIISIDGNGFLTQHFPEQKAVSGKLVQGKEVALNFSYKLDNAPMFERFYFITGEESFSSSDLEISMNDGTVSSVAQKNLTVVEVCLEK